MPNIEDHIRGVVNRLRDKTKSSYAAARELIHRLIGAFDAIADMLFGWISTPIFAVFLTIFIPVFFPGKWRTHAVIIGCIIGFLLVIRFTRRIPFGIVTRFVAVILAGGLLLLLGQKVYVASATWVEPDKPEAPPPPPQCSIAADARADIVSVVHWRGKIVPPGQRIQMEPKYQDLFVEWTFTLHPTGVATDPIFQIFDTKKPLDSLRVDLSGSGDDSKVTGVENRWNSNFPDRAHPPDYYARAVEFTKLSGLATIITRRPIVASRRGENKIFPKDLDFGRGAKLSSSSCKVSGLKTTYDDDPLFNQLVNELRTLAAMKSGNGNVHTRLNPEAPFPTVPKDEKETIMEVRCGNPECKGILVNREGSRLLTEPQVTLTVQ
jgi:hypothetical protein